METPPTTLQPQYVPPIQPLPPQPQYVQPQYTQPHQGATIDQRITEDTVEILDHVDSPWQALSLIFLALCGTLIFIVVYITRSKGKEILTTLRDIRESKALNGPFDELVNDIKDIKEETVKNSKQNEIDHKRWMAYCSNPKNMNKKECLIHAID